MAKTFDTSDSLTAASLMFNGGRLTMARQLSGLKKSHLASMVGMSPASVTSWENGSKQPNRQTVAKLAFALKVEPHFFRGGTPVSTDKPHFRSLRSTPQIARDKAEAYGQFVAEIASMLENTVEFPAVSLPEIPVDPDAPAMTPEDAARATRKFFGLDPGPVKHVIRLAEQAGVIVVFSEPSISAIDAYSMHTANRPIIILNPAKDDYYRQRFDVAHELGHLIMHHDVDPGSKAAEDQANQFAAEFLMPAHEIAAFLPSSTAGKGWVQLMELKEHWGGSIVALLYRARKLGVMSDVTYRNAMMRMSQNGWRRAEPGQTTTLEMPSSLPQARELLNSVGIDDDKFLSGAGLPTSMYEIATSRTPKRNYK